MIEAFIDRFPPCIGTLLWNIETDEGRICNRILSVLKYTYILLTCKILSLFDDTFLVRAKCQNVNKKHGLVDRICT